MKRIAVIAASLLLLASAAIAQQRRGPAPGGPGGPGGNSAALAEYLGLTSDQKAAWESIQTELRTSGRALHEQERTLAEQLESATDAATIGTLVLQLRGIHTQLEAAHDAAQTKFAALLTAEQQTKFAAFEAASAFLRQRGPGGPPPQHP